MSKPTVALAKNGDVIVRFTAQKGGKLSKRGTVMFPENNLGENEWLSVDVPEGRILVHMVYGWATGTKTVKPKQADVLQAMMQQLAAMQAQLNAR